MWFLSPAVCILLKRIYRTEQMPFQNTLNLHNVCLIGVYGVWERCECIFCPHATKIQILYCFYTDITFEKKRKKKEQFESYLNRVAR